MLQSNEKPDITGLSDTLDEENQRHTMLSGNQPHGKNMVGAS